MARRWTKALVSLAFTGAAIGGAIAYRKHITNRGLNDKFSDDFEDEDFDLDADLEDVANREYVTLNIQHEAADEPEDTAAETDTTDIAEEASAAKETVDEE